MCIMYVVNIVYVQYRPANKKAPNKNVMFTSGSNKKMSLRTRARFVDQIRKSNIRKSLSV